MKVNQDEEEMDFIVGRLPSHPVCLSHSLAVNRTHAKIHYSDDLYWEIEDMGSSTGTFLCVGNTRCYYAKTRSDADCSRELEDGDIISIPNLDLTFHYL